MVCAALLYTSPLIYMTFDRQAEAHLETSVLEHAICTHGQVSIPPRRGGRDRVVPEPHVTHYP